MRSSLPSPFRSALIVSSRGEIPALNGEPGAGRIQGQRGVRNSPTLLNRAYGSSQFWDGRKGSLEEQPLEAIQNPKEMDMTLEELEKRLISVNEYSKQFKEVLGEKPDP